MARQAACHPDSVLDSAASGLYFLGYKQLAVLIASTKNQSDTLLNSMGCLHTFFETKTNKEEKRKINYGYWGSNC
jgi:hypothetical protein